MRPPYNASFIHTLFINYFNDLFREVCVIFSDVNVICLFNWKAKHAYNNSDELNGMMKMSRFGPLKCKLRPVCVSVPVLIVAFNLSRKRSKETRNLLSSLTLLATRRHVYLPPISPRAYYLFYYLLTRPIVRLRWRKLFSLVLL